MKVEVTVASNEAQEGSDDDDDEIVVVPYVKPPPTIISLVESDQSEGEDDEEDTASSSKPSKKTHKKNKKDKTDKSTKKSGRQDKTSKTKKGAKDKDKSDRSKDANHKTTSKSTRHISTTENDDSDPANANANVTSVNDRRKDKSGNDSGSGLTTTSNIFQPSSAALADSANSVYQDDQDDRENGRKRKASESRYASKTKTRVRTNSSKSAEEESREDSLRFVRTLGLPASPVPDSAREVTPDPEVPEDEQPRTKKSSKKSKSKRTKSRREGEDESEPESEINEAITEPEPDRMDIAEVATATASNSNPVSESESIIEIESDQSQEDEEAPVASKKVTREEAGRRSAETPAGQPTVSSNQRSSGTVQPQQTEERPSSAGTNQNSSAVKRLIPLPDTFPYKWTAEMKRYYGESIADKDTADIENNQVNDYNTGGKACRCCGRQPGEHVAAGCPATRFTGTRVCFVCGSQGHPSPSHSINLPCPNALCLSCGHRTFSFQRGCPRCTQQVNPIKCFICGMTGHGNRDCPDHWRRYHNVTDFGMGDQTSETENSMDDEDQTATGTAEGSTRKFKYVARPNQACANCGQRAHNYFHCHKPRMNADGSEYSGEKGAVNWSYYPHKPYIVRELTPDDFREIDLVNANCSHPNELTISIQAQVKNGANPVAVAVQGQTAGSRHQPVESGGDGEVVANVNVLELNQPAQPAFEEAVNAVKHCIEEGVTLLSDRGKLQLKGTPDAIEKSKAKLRQFMRELKQDDKDATGSGSRNARQFSQIPNSMNQRNTQRRHRYFEPLALASENSKGKGQEISGGHNRAAVTAVAPGVVHNSSTSTSSPKRGSSRSRSPRFNLRSANKDVTYGCTQQRDHRFSTTEDTNSTRAETQSSAPVCVSVPEVPVSSSVSKKAVTVSPPESVFPILQPPPRALPRHPTMNFHEDDMVALFDVDERLFTVDDFAQAPYLSVPFASPTKEYIAIPLPMPIPSIVSQPTATFSFNVNSFHNLNVQNSAPAPTSAKQATETSVVREPGSVTSRQNNSTSTPDAPERPTPTPAAAVSVNDTTKDVAEADKVRQACEIPGPSGSSKGGGGDKLPESPEVIVLD